MISKFFKSCIIAAASGAVLLLAGSMPLPEKNPETTVNPEIIKLRNHNVNSKNLASSDIQQKNPLILLELTVE